MSEAVALELIAERDAKLLREGRHGDPFAVLGRHRFGDADIVRVMAPEAAVVEVVGGAKSIRLRPHGHALFAGLIPRAYRKDYKLQITGPNGISIEQDPYRFGLVHDAIDLQQFKTGLHLRVFELLGGRECELEGVCGVAFTVWAPAASWVSVVGDFNHWNACKHLMRFRHEAGLWELFMPDLGAGTTYEYRVGTATDVSGARRADPYSLECSLEGRARVSALQDLTGHPRRAKPWPARSVHIDLRDWLSSDGPAQSIGDDLADYAQQHGAQAIVVAPLYRRDAAGDPINLITLDPLIGALERLKGIVSSVQQRGVAVFMDWDSSTFSPLEGGLSAFDGLDCYEHPGAQRRPKTNGILVRHARHEAGNYALTSAVYWLDIIGLDGLVATGIEDIVTWPVDRAVNIDGVSYLRTLAEVVAGRPSAPSILTSETRAIPGFTQSGLIGGVGFSGAVSCGVFDAAKALSGAFPQQAAAARLELNDELLIGRLQGSVAVIRGGGMDADVLRIIAALVTVTQRSTHLIPGDVSEPREPNGEIDWRRSAGSTAMGFRHFVRSLADLAARGSRAAVQARECEMFDPFLVAHIRSDGILSVINFGPVARSEAVTGFASRQKWRLKLDSQWAEFGGKVPRSEVTLCADDTGAVPFNVPGRTALIYERVDE